MNERQMEFLTTQHHSAQIWLRSRQILPLWLGKVAAEQEAHQCGF